MSKKHRVDYTASNENAVAAKTFWLVDGQQVFEGEEIDPAALNLSGSKLVGIKEIVGTTSGRKRRKRTVNEIDLDPAGPIPIVSAPILAINAAGTATLTAGIYGDVTEFSVTYTAFGPNGESIAEVSSPFFVGTAGDWYVVETAVAPGYLPTSQQTNTVTYTPAVADTYLTADQWSVSELLSPSQDASPRKLSVSTSVAPDASRKRRVAVLTDPTTAIGSATLADMTGSGPYTYTTAQQTAAATVYIRLAQADTDNTDPAWVSDPVAVTISTVPGGFAATASTGTVATGDILVTVPPDVPDGGQPLTKYQYSIDGGTTPVDMAAPDAGGDLWDDGLRTINLTAGSKSIVFRAVNPNGNGAWSSPVTVLPKPAVPVDPPTGVIMASSLEQIGVGLTFSEPVPMLQLANGDWAVITTNAVTITARTPAAGNDAQGWAYNGMMFDPWTPGGVMGKVPLDRQQGWDRRMQNPDNDKARVPYNPDLDITTKLPYTVPAGTNSTLVLSLRDPDPVDMWEVFELLHPVHFLSAAPAAGNKAHPPGISGLTKTIYGDTDNTNYNILRSISPTDSGTLAGALANVRRRTNPSTIFAGGTGQGITGGADQYRLMEVEGPIAPETYAQRKMKDFYRAHFSNASTDEKRRWLNREIANGITLYESYLRGNRYYWGAQAAGGYWPCIVYAGFALNNLDMLAAAEQIWTCAKDQAFTQSEEYLGTRTTWPSGSENSTFYFRQPAPLEMLGDAEWYRQGWDKYPKDAFSYYDSRFYSRYRNAADSIVFSEILAVCALQNGPGGMTGADWLASIGRVDTILYMDRLRTYTPAGSLDMNLDDGSRAFYDAIRPLISPALQANKPYRLRPISMTGRSDGFRADFVNLNFSQNTAITDRQVEISLDARSVVRFTGLSNAQNVTSGVMLGQKHFARARYVNAEGLGPWTDFDPGSFGGNPQGGFTSLGTPPTAAPVNSVLPGIFFKPEMYVQNRRFVQVSGTVPDYVNYIYGGIGYWHGGGKPTSWTYQFKRNGVVMSSGTITEAGTSGTEKLGEVTTARYAINDSGDLGGTWTFEVTAINGSGSTTAVSAGVTMFSAFPDVGSLLPSGVYNASPDNFDHLWQDSGVQIVFRDFVSPTVGDNESPPRWKIRQSSLGRRFWAVAIVPGFGDATSIAEGELVIASDYSSTTSSSELIIRASGDASTASGYACRLEITSNNSYRFVVRKIINGVWQSPSASSTVTVSDGSKNSKTANFHAEFALLHRVNWRIEGGSLVIRQRVAREPNSVYPPLPETTEWGFTYTDPTPLSGGRVGLGLCEGLGTRDAYHLGLSRDPDVSAPWKPKSPAYTYD